MKCFLDRVLIEEIGNVAVVKLSRSKKLNALDMDMFRGIRDAARYLMTKNDIRAIVLHGEGRAFSAGLDAKSIAVSTSALANLEELLRRDAGSTSNLAQDVSFLWRKIPAPVICAVHGVCFGGGLQIALGADLRFTDKSTKFAIMEAKWGLIPDMGLTTSLPNLIPRDIALDLTFSGQVFNGDQALQMGLVTRVCKDPIQQAIDYAKNIATNASPDATAAAKKLLHATYDDARVLRLETQLQRRLLGSWNNLAKSAQAFHLPLVPGFINRNPIWSQEADDLAEAKLQGNSQW